MARRTKQQRERQREGRQQASRDYDSAVDKVYRDGADRSPALPQPARHPDDVAWPRRFVRRHETLAKTYRVAKRITRRLARSGWFTWVIGPLVATYAFNFIAFNSDIHPDDLGYSGLLANILVFAITLLVVQLVRYAELTSWIRVLTEIATFAKERERPFLDRLVQNRLREVRDTIKALVEGDFQPDPPEAMASYFQSFFEQGGATYIGIDSHRPTEYMETYDWYLTVHEAELKRRMSHRRDTRVVIASRNDLTEDYLRDSPRYLQFVRWHEKNSVRLLWIDPSDAADLRARHGVQDDLDVGLWERHAVTFKRGTGERSLALAMRFPGDTAEFDPSWQQLLQYARDIEAAAETMTEGPPGLDVVDADLARAWGEYVDVHSRTDPSGAWGGFLLRTLDGRQHVLDAGAGIGCESILLLRRGHSVTSNEVDANLAAVAVELSAKQGMRLDMRKYLWETLAAELPGAMMFDAVLCVGNSLCLVEEERRREASVQSFYNVLTPGGVLVIDERNFTYILRNKESILAKPQTYPPVQSLDIMYAGSTVRGVPTVISEERISWRLFDRSGVHSRSDVEARVRGKQALWLHPFGHGELYRLLEEVGFSDIEVYGDLKRVCAGGMPSYEVVKGVNFLTYVAHKPVTTEGPVYDDKGRA